MKKGKIGRRRKYQSRPKKKANVLPVDLFSIPLGDRFFLSSNSIVCLEAPVNRREYSDSDGFQADEFFVILDKPYRYCPDIDLDDFVGKKIIRIFSRLNENCKRHVTNENFSYMKSSNDIKFLQFYDSDSHWDSPRVKTCVCIGRDLKIHISIHGREIPDNHKIWKSIGRYCMSVKAVEHVLAWVQKYDVCCGNQDRELQNLIPVGTFLGEDRDFEYQGYRESFYIGSTIRSKKCNLLINTRTSVRCEHCNTYRRTLRKTLSRRQNSPKEATAEKDWLKSTIPNSLLTENQKFQKLKELKEHSSKLEIEVARLKREVKKKTQKADSERQDLVDKLEREREIQQSDPDENSLQRIFLEQQRKHVNLKAKTSMRWHPAIIKWCISLKSKSAAAYDALKNSGFVKLPSERTLFEYTHLTKKGTGDTTRRKLDLLAALEETPSPKRKREEIITRENEVQMINDSTVEKCSDTVEKYCDTVEKCSDTVEKCSDTVEKCSDPVEKCRDTVEKCSSTD